MSHIRTVFHIVDELLNVCSDIDQHYQDHVLHYDMQEIPAPFLEIANATRLLKRQLAELRGEGEGQAGYGTTKSNRKIPRNYAASEY